MDNNNILEEITVFIPQWKVLSPEEISLKKMTGITNNIFKVSHTRKDVQPECLIYRRFGSDIESTYVNKRDPYLHR
jgi:hypothetical protein